MKSSLTAIEIIVRGVGEIKSNRSPWSDIAKAYPNIILLNSFKKEFDESYEALDGFDFKCRKRTKNFPHTYTQRKEQS